MTASARPLLVAHRGYSAICRENSPEAWRKAAEAGADVVEADVRFTADGVAVCCHDSDLSRLTGRPAAIAETDAAILATIEADGMPAAPTLEALFAELPADQAVLLDVKDERPQTIDRLLAILATFASAPIFLGLHRIETLRRVRRHSDQPVVGLIDNSRDADAFFTAGGDILRLWEANALPGAIETAAKRALPIWVTTGHRDTGRRVGDFDADVLRRLAGEGVAAFLVNDPLAARAAISAISRSPA